MERVDRLVGHRLENGRKPQAAIDVARLFADEGPCYISTSWGKDSVVALHLAVRAGLSAPVVHIVQEGPHKDPEQYRVRDAFLARFHVDYHEITVEQQVSEQREDGKTPALQVGIRRAVRRFGPRWIGGLRAAESGRRTLSARRGSRDSCWPIKWWSGAEVYGYLAHHDLPVHPTYACTQAGLWDRDWLRVSIIGGAKGTGTGRRKWEWRYYPDVMRRLGLPR